MTQPPWVGDLGGPMFSEGGGNAYVNKAAVLLPESLLLHQQEEC